jgi:hypothetical protein
MNENELALRLSRLEIPGRGAALDRCLGAYRESATVHERPPKRLRFVPRRQFRLALALTAAAGIVALAFTPPGRAVADWVVDLVGVGEPPTVAPEPPAGGRWNAAPPQPTVIASGLTARGEPFEWVFQGASKGVCFSLELPAGRFPGEGGGGCSEQIPRASADYPILAYGTSSSGAGVEVNGILAPEVKSVELSYPVDGETQTIDAVMGRISSELLRKAGGNPNNPRDVFIAFLPKGVRAEEVTATAYDSEGDVVGAATWPDLDDLPGAP